MITEKQKGQLISLNDSRVNEILGVKKFEVGKWYKGSVDFDSLIYITTIINTDSYNQIYYYGFLRGGKYNIGYIVNTDHEKSLVPATNEEVQEALTKEAKRRGFKNIGELSIVNASGMYFEKGFFSTDNNKYEFYPKYNTLYLDGVTIFKDGKWAEIIEIDPIKEQIEKLEKELNKLKEEYGKKH